MWLCRQYVANDAGHRKTAAAHTRRRVGSQCVVVVYPMVVPTQKLRVRGRLDACLCVLAARRLILRFQSNTVVAKLVQHVVQAHSAAIERGGATPTHRPSGSIV